MRKDRKLAGMVSVVREDHGEECIEGNQGARSAQACIKATEKQENKQGDKRKRQNQDTQICQPKVTNAIKNDDTKLAKKK